MSNAPEVSVSKVSAQQVSAAPTPPQVLPEGQERVTFAVDREVDGRTYRADESAVFDAATAYHLKAVGVARAAD